MATADEFSLRSTRVVTGDNMGPRTVVVRSGLIAEVLPNEAGPQGLPLLDAGSAVVMPGVVDSHVHINQPGRTEWEGFETATRAAAKGGVTTIVDMPLNSNPPTTTQRALNDKLNAIDASKLWVDVALTGGAVPTNGADLVHLSREGVVAFKCFLAPSGIDEFPHVGGDDLAALMKQTANLGATLLVHAEDASVIAAASNAARLPESRAYATYLESRPNAAETRAVKTLVALSRSLNARAHIVHLSAADALTLVRDAQDAGVPISAETCPHYLTFAAEEIPDGATAYKCAPPIRERENRERLWDGLRQGVIRQIVTDHSPAPPALKCVDSGDFSAAWGGISSLELGLAAIWTEARARGFRITDLAKWMCAEPARLVGLDDRKGEIAVGRDADIVVWDPDSPFRVEPEALAQRHKLTPYAGRTLVGRVLKTIVRGEIVYDQGQFLSTPRGRWIKRSSR